MGLAVWTGLLSRFEPPSTEGQPQPGCLSSPRADELELTFTPGKPCALCQARLPHSSASWQLFAEEAPGCWGLLVAHSASGAVARNPTLPWARTPPWHESGTVAWPL